MLGLKIKKKRLDEYELKEYVLAKTQDEEKAYLEHGYLWQNLRSKFIVESTIKGSDQSTQIVS